MLFILALAKRLPGQERMALSGDWRAQATVTGDDLVGQALGIVGLGRISWELIRLLEPFGMRVLAYPRHCRTEEAVGARLNWWVCNPLTGLDNVILTPHWLPTTQRAVRLVGVAMAEGILRAARGQVPENVVNPEVLKREGFKAKLARFEVNG